MTMSSALANAESMPTQTADIEDLFSGNLCRCTGYRPILCAMKTYAADGNAAEIANTPAYVLDESVGYGNGAVSNKNVGVIDFNPASVAAAAAAAPAASAGRCKSTSAPQRVSSLKSGVQKPLAASSLRARAPSSGLAHSWFSPSPRSFADLCSLVSSGVLGANYKLVCGNTSYGVFPQWEWAGVETFVDTSAIEGYADITRMNAAEQKAFVRRTRASEAPLDRSSNNVPIDHFLNIGPGVPIQSLIQYLHTQEHDASILATTLVRHLKRVAGHQVRSVGSVGGSLMMARFWNFPSDTWLCLEAAGATVVVGWVDPATGSVTNAEVSMAELANTVGCEIVLQAILLPVFLDTVPAASKLLRTYRVAQRLQNAHPLVNAGFFFDRQSAPSIVWGNLTQTNVSNLSSGGDRVPIQTATSHYRLSSDLCAMMLAAFINGWAVEPGLSLEAVLAAVQSELQSVVFESESQGDSATRVDIALNLLRKFAIACMDAPASAAEVATADSSIYAIRTSHASAGSQSFLVSRDEEPVSEPLIKSSALHQTSGLTTYTQSILQEGALHATFITSWAANGELTINPACNPSQLACDYLSEQFGLVYAASQFTVFTSTDLGAANLANASSYSHTPMDRRPSNYFGFETLPSFLLAQGEVVYSGQPIAILVGPDERAVTLVAEFLSTQASQYALIVSTTPPILSIEQSKAAGTVMVNGFPVPTALTAVYEGSYASLNTISNLPNNASNIDFTSYKSDPRFVYVQGTHAVPSQNHMYMETQGQTNT